MSAGVSRPRRAAAAALAITALAATATAGCATTRYEPRVVARGELTLRYDGGFEAWAGGRRVARGLGWAGLPEYVRCVPEAHEHALSAANHGIAAHVMTGFATVFALGGLGGLAAGVADGQNTVGWLGAGIASASIGLVFGILAQRFKNASNGHAVDALDHYNDAVGSLGATCDDLRYPAPAGPPPGEAQQPAMPPPAEPPPPPAPAPSPGG